MSVRAVPSRPAPRRATARKGRASVDLVSALRARIASQDVPPGAKLRENELAAEFGVPRTRVREAFLKHHADFFEASMWQGYKDRLLSGQMHDFYAYDAAERFVNRYGASAPDNAAQDNATLQRAAA